MRCTVIHEQQLTIHERENPVPGAGDVVVRVRGAGINAADLLQRLGFYPAPAGWPADVPGLEIAGLVEQVGEGVSPALVGRRVCAIVGGGGQATHCVVPAEHLLTLPDDIDWVAAAGFAETFTTAFDALVRQAQLAPGERTLISGAAGGVGTAAVQLAKARGAHVIAVTRDTTHHEALRRLGADETITIEEVATLAPVDIVLELVGAAHLSQAQRILAPRARVVVIGVGGGARVEVDLLALMATRATLTGSTLRARHRDEKAEIALAMQESVMPLLARGEIQVPVAATFALDDVAEAYEHFGRAGKLGKVVLLNEE
jgi:NADPH:quinone reductase